MAAIRCGLGVEDGLARRRPGRGCSGVERQRQPPQRRRHGSRHGEESSIRAESEPRFVRHSRRPDGVVGRLRCGPATERSLTSGRGRRPGVTRLPLTGESASTTIRSAFTPLTSRVTPFGLSFRLIVSENTAVPSASIVTLASRLASGDVLGDPDDGLELAVVAAERVRQDRVRRRPAAPSGTISVSSLSGFVRQPGRAGTERRRSAAVPSRPAGSRARRPAGSRSERYATFPCDVVELRERRGRRVLDHDPGDGRDRDARRCQLDRLRDERVAEHVDAPCTASCGTSWAGAAGRTPARRGPRQAAASSSCRPPSRSSASVPSALPPRIVPWTKFSPSGSRITYRSRLPRSGEHLLPRRRGSSGRPASRMTEKTRRHRAVRTPAGHCLRRPGKTSASTFFPFRRNLATAEGRAVGQFDLVI